MRNEPPKKARDTRLKKSVYHVHDTSLALLFSVIALLSTIFFTCLHFTISEPYCNYSLQGGYNEIL